MKIVFYSPHSAIWSNVLRQALLAHKLQLKGHKVIFITSGSQFKHCDICLGGNGLTRHSKIKDQQKIDKLGIINEKIVKEEFGLKGYDIGNVLTDGDFKQIAQIMKRLNMENFYKLQIEKIMIGKISLYEFLLHNKKMNLNFNQDEAAECMIDLKNTLISYFACKHVIKMEKPDVILTFGDLYSVNHVWVKYAEKLGIPTYLLTQGFNLSEVNETLIVARCSSINFQKELINIWQNISKIPISHKMMSSVTNHFFELIKAKHFLVYSLPKSNTNLDIRQIYNINNNQKILTATMSSYDELLAAECVGEWKIPKNLIFSSQIDWLKALIKYIKNRKDLFLLIRVHPREFPNKRDKVKSEHARMLEEIFRNLPENVKVNWPADNISIFDLAKETNVFLNAWSSVGVEMSLLGIPVVIYSKELILYPHDLNYLAKNRKDYFAKIELALKEGWSYEKIKKTFRWLSFNFSYPVIKLSKKIYKTGDVDDKKNTLSFLYYVYSKIPDKIKTILYVPLSGLINFVNERNKKTECIIFKNECAEVSKIETMLKESLPTIIDSKQVLVSNNSNEFIENKFLKKEIRKIYKALYGGNKTNRTMEVNNLQNNLKHIIANNR